MNIFYWIGVVAIFLMSVFCILGGILAWIDADLPGFCILIILGGIIGIVWNILNLCRKLQNRSNY